MRGSVISFVLLSFLLGANLAWAVTWSEVARFPIYWGTAPNLLGEQRTDNFACNQSQWRIVWNYTPISIVDPENVYFNIFIYRTNDTVYYIMEMNQQGNTTTSGTWYINNQTGDFNLKFLVYNVLNSTVLIEQATVTVPEFPLMALVLLSGAGTLAAVTLARKRIREDLGSSRKIHQVTFDPTSF